MQLHVVEELLALFTADEVTGSEPASPESAEPETLCSLSIHAMNGSAAEASGAIQLHAVIGDHGILLLVDSGSSTSFINKQLAESLSGAIPLSKPCRVQVADGSSHRCTTFLPLCAWTSMGHTFHTDLKVLPLGSYDAILGMDWLECHNPDIDWVDKTLKFQSAKGLVTLTGHKSNNVQCSAISASELNTICRT